MQLSSLNASHYSSCLSLIGASVIVFWCSKVFYSVMKALYSYIIGSLELNVAWAKMGKWAVITGGTDGIGKAYAEELARRGFDIVLISRNEEKLSSVAEHIRNHYAVDTKVISVDFTGGPAIYDKIKTEIEGLEVGVLVNNVGMSYEFAEYFHCIPDGQKVIDQLICTNVVSCTMMMRMILPQMEKKKRGVVINISSLTALYPMPLLAVYAACKVTPKAYVDYLTRAVQVEYRDKGIIIQSVLPAFVATKMSKIKKTSLEVPLPETFVHSAIGTVGTESYTYGYLPHKIRGYMHEILRAHMPERINMGIELSVMSKIRERYYKKLAKNKK